MTPDRSTTPRGFSVYDEFADTNGSKIRVQQSSSATEDAVWIFAEHDADHLPAQHRARLAAAGFTRPVDFAELGAMLVPSPHLDVAQARRMRDALGEFIAEHEAREGGRP